jgi:hypothetical protein
MVSSAAPPAEAEPATSARRYATSNLTRLLCAGARLDRTFGKQVIRTLLTNRERFAAPAYGYDLVPVLGHALAARGLRRVRSAVVVASVLLVSVLLFTTGIGWIGAAAVLAWLTWTAIFFERVLALQTVVSYLRPADGLVPFDGRYPRHGRLDAELVRQLAEEQDASAGLVYYGGYLPFVGAGERVRNWSFAVLLDSAAPDALTGSDRGEPIPFTVDELTDYVRRRLGEVLIEESLDGQQIEQLVVERRWYRKAVAIRRPIAPRAEVESLRRLRHGPQLYDSAREYLCVRIGAWDQDLVTSVFVAFDLKGRTLYSELHGYVLPPIKPAFSAVDRMPGRLTSGTLLRVGWHAVKSIVVDVLGVLGVIASAIAAAVGWLVRLFGRSSGEQFGADDLARYADGLIDYGAMISIRELAAIKGFRHFFQEIDAKKYITIVERRLMEIVLDFMEEHHVDTGDFRERQTAVLNYGIIHSGSGNVTNTGTQAFGPEASAQGGKGKES